MTDHEQPRGDVPVEDYGGDSPTRPAPPAAAPPAPQAGEPPGALPVAADVLEDTPVAGYGGNQPTTAHGEEPPA